MASRWRRWPLPPWTARPAGLSITISQSSRNSTRSRRAAASCPLGRGGAARDRTQGRHPDPLARAQPQAGLGAPPVDPHLAGAQKLFQAPVGERGKAPPEPAVEPEVRLLVGHGQGLDAACLAVGHAGSLGQSAGAEKPPRPPGGLQAASGRGGVDSQDTQHSVFIR